MTVDAEPFKISISTSRSSSIDAATDVNVGNNENPSSRRRLFATPAPISPLASLFVQSQASVIKFNLTLPHYKDETFGGFGIEEQRFECKKDEVR